MPNCYQYTFSWASISSYHMACENKEFWGTLTLQYQAGQIVLLRIEETLKPLVRETVDERKR